MAPSPFHLRFGYAGWLYHLRTGRAPKFSEIGRVTERTGVAVAAWLTADEPPPDWRVHEPLSTFLAVDELWLIRDEGDAPDPELWARWKAARRVTTGGRRGAQVEDAPIPAARGGARKKAKGA